MMHQHQQRLPRPPTFEQERYGARFSALRPPHGCDGWRRRTRWRRRWRRWPRGFGFQVHPVKGEDILAHGGPGEGGAAGVNIFNNPRRRCRAPDWRAAPRQRENQGDGDDVDERRAPPPRVVTTRRYRASPPPRVTISWWRHVLRAHPTPLTPRDL